MLRFPQLPASPGPAASRPDIVVLEDDPAVRSCVLDILDDGGFRCVGAADPDRTLALFDRPTGPSLLLTDIDLGVRGLDGFEVARRLRACRPSLPVLFTSGRSWLLAQHRCQPHDRILPKPFRGAVLLALVHELLPHAAPALSVPA